jgi:kynurenine formamidase
MTRFIELNHPLVDGEVTYPGLPAPRITEHLSREASRAVYADGVEFHIGRIEMIANTGTYLDTPFHRWPDGDDLAAVPLAAVAGLPGVVVDGVGGGQAVDVAAFAAVDVGGRAVLVRTGWDRHWGTPAYGERSPFLTAGAAAALVERGAALVGIDSLNIDDVADRSRPVHSQLLRAGIPIVEHLSGLDALGSEPFSFFAPPVRVVGMGTFPVRAFAVID